MAVGEDLQEGLDPGSAGAVTPSLDLDPVLVVSLVWVDGAAAAAAAADEVD